MRAAEIQVGKTYRFCGYRGRELKPRTVVKFDPSGDYAGGSVTSHTGLTRFGKPSQMEVMAGDYFAEHVLED